MSTSPKTLTPGAAAPAGGLQPARAETFRTVQEADGSFDDRLERLAAESASNADHNVWIERLSPAALGVHDRPVARDLLVDTHVGLADRRARAALLAVLVHADVSEEPPIEPPQDGVGRIRRRRR